MECWLRLPGMVENVETPAAGTAKISWGRRSWPAWVEVACSLAVGEEDL